MMYCVNTYVATFFFVNKHKPKQYLHVGVKNKQLMILKSSI